MLIIFTFDQFYPAGGWNDKVAIINDITEITSDIVDKLRDFVQIISVEDDEAVFKGSKSEFVIWAINSK